MVKKILSIVAWVITAAALVALFIFAREYYLKQPVKSVNLNIEREQDSGFVKETIILNKVGHMCEKSKIGTFNMMAVKNQMHSNPWVETSSAFIDMQGILNINVKEYDLHLVRQEREGFVHAPGSHVSAPRVDPAEHFFHQPCDLGLIVN